MVGTMARTPEQKPWGEDGQRWSPGDPEVAHLSAWAEATVSAHPSSAAHWPLNPGEAGDRLSASESMCDSGGKRERPLCHWGKTKR